MPLVPAVLGLVLGPLSELQFRRAMAISEGDISDVRDASDLRGPAAGRGDAVVRLEIGNEET